ncbi:unnamed protein product [Schistosoma mansoni]|uniref:Smp_206010 n=1 Tax=Schistosoma mansoni TaxID=6183 RepID=UPI00022C8725|nr:unnamed protein product [Schistosoma mansoni]|eukprot:XP_018644801.1 unnamed protein product [Schistosoma mansoni]
MYFIVIYMISLLCPTPLDSQLMKVEVAWVGFDFVTLFLVDLNPSRVSAGCSELSPIPASQSVSLDNLNQNNYPNNSYQMPAVGCRPAPIGTVHADTPQVSDTHGPRPFGDMRSDIDPGIFSTSGRGGTSSRDVQESGLGPTRHRAVLGSGVHNDYPQPWVNRDQGVRKGDTHKNTPNYYQGHDYSRDRRGGYSQQWSTNHRGSRGSGHTYGGWGGRSTGGHDWSKFRSNASTVNEHTNFSVEYDYERANAELAAELEKITISTVSVGCVMISLSRKQARQVLPSTTRRMMEAAQLRMKTRAMISPSRFSIPLVPR